MTVEEELPFTNSAQNCAKTKGHFCIGLCIVFILCYAYFQNILLYIIDILIRLFIFGTSLFKSGYYMKLYNFICQFRVHLLAALFMNHKFAHFVRFWVKETLQSFCGHNYIYSKICRQTRKVKLYSIDSVNCIKIKESIPGTTSIAKDLSLLKNHVSLYTINTEIKHLKISSGRLFKLIYVRNLEKNGYHIGLPCDTILVLTIYTSNLLILYILGTQNSKNFTVLCVLNYKGVL